MIEDLVRIAEIAGSEILNVYKTDFTVERKTDESPVTLADLRAHEIIVDALTALDPSVPILSEENEVPDFSVRRSWKRYWIVDPLDGTQDFIERNGEFTVNIALIDEGRPVMGVVGLPTQGRTYSADFARGVVQRRTGSSAEKIATRKRLSNRVAIVESRHNSHPLNDAIASLLESRGTTVQRKAVGSSFKMCVIAQGDADVYVRFGTTSEWDIAAAHAILKTASGDLRWLDGSPLLYNQKASIRNPAFFACGDAPQFWADHISDAISSHSAESTQS